MRPHPGLQTFAALVGLVPDRLRERRVPDVVPHSHVTHVQETCDVLECAQRVVATVLGSMGRLELHVTCLP